MAIELTGFEIWAIRCNAGPTNQQLLSQLGISKTELPFPNPADVSRHIFVLYDVPHLLELLCSHILDEGNDVDGKGAVKSSTNFLGILDQNTGEFKIHPELIEFAGSVCAVFNHVFYLNVGVWNWSSQRRANTYFAKDDSNCRNDEVCWKKDIKQ